MGIMIGIVFFGLFLAALYAGVTSVANVIATAQRNKQLAKPRQPQPAGVWRTRTVPASGGWQVQVEHPQLGQQIVHTFSAEQAAQDDFDDELAAAQVRAETIVIRLNDDLIRGTRDQERNAKLLRGR